MFALIVALYFLCATFWFFYVQEDWLTRLLVALIWPLFVAAIVTIWAADKWRGGNGEPPSL